VKGWKNKASISIIKTQKRNCCKFNPLVCFLFVFVWAVSLCGSDSFYGSLPVSFAHPLPLSFTLWQNRQFARVKCAI